MPIRSIGRIACALAIVAATLPVAAFATQSDAKVREAKLAPAAQSEGKRRLNRIKKEIARSKNHEWAGEYAFGDGLGVNVSLAVAPQAGFVFTWHGCTGLYDLNYGDVTVVDGTLRLIFTFPNDREGFQGIAPEFFLVRWGKRHYLIATDEVPAFCNDISAGYEPRNRVHGDALLRRGDEQVKAPGWPDLPAEFRDYLLKEPIRTAIASVETSRVEVDAIVPDVKRVVTDVTLGAGRAEGVRVGMAFRESERAGGMSAMVTRVDEHTSTATIVQAIYPNVEADKPPAAGLKMATRLDWDPRPQDEASPPR